MNIEMNETYARDTSTVWEHEIIIPGGSGCSAR